MKKPHPKPKAAIALILALVLASVSSVASAAEGDCLDKRAIQQAVSAGQIMSLDAVLASAGVDRNQKILNVQVCDESGQLVYIIGVLSPNGQAENLVLSAQ